MQLLQSWKDSLAIFVPKNFKLFFLVTLKAIVETFSALFRYCWAPILIFLVITVRRDPIGPFSLSDFLWASGFPFLLIFLAARSSVLRKGYRYFSSYWYYWVYVVLFRFLQGLIALALAYYFGNSFLFSRLLIILGVIFLYVPDILAAFFMLFLLDSDGSPKSAVASIWRAIKMFAYNFPAALLVWIVGFVPGICIFWYLDSLKIGYVGSIVSYGIFIITLLFGICFMTNFYIKRLHDQCGIYFETKEKE